MIKIAFDKHPDFVVRQENPFNAGPPPKLLNQSYITPTNLFFVRSHGEVPEVNLSSYRLEINGRVLRPLSLSLDEIKNNFERVNVSATLQCAGNRREELMALESIPNELGWGVEAISHAVWTGTRLRDVLAVVGLEGETDSHLHVELGGLDEMERHHKHFQYGGSIPLGKAMSTEVILAYEMNGEPLSPVHGYPLRVIVPGYIGARSVKWLNRLIVQNRPSQNYFQSHAYRLFASHMRPETVEWEDGVMLGEMNVTSVICSHDENEWVQRGLVAVQGYSMAGGREIARVDVSCDGGHTWVQAELFNDGSCWAWTLWKASFELSPGKYQLVVRAMDASANTQPQDVSQVWNFKGYMNNAWHRVNIEVG
ncbi:MAG TPA: molybdopterin-dependent oxidoreductase [Anaerolineales bacterium]|nr:molybdopterin-dependent oxidoreductase [Anaerolineales bacterium]